MGILKNSTPVQKPSDNYEYLIICYRAMVDTMRQGQAMKASATFERFDNTRYHRLEIKVDDLWIKLSDDEQISAVYDLIKSGHMTQRYADILILFKGRINMDNPPEPCWSP